MTETACVKLKFTNLHWLMT